VTFVRYVLVQLAAYAVDMGMFLALLKSGFIGPVLANIPAKIAAGIFAFFLHRWFTFRVSHQDREKRQVLQYFALLAINVPISSAVLSLVLLVIDADVVAKFVADVICVVFSFWMSKTWVFKARQDPSTAVEAGKGRL
jgi:putative flippase GtrA